MPLILKNPYGIAPAYHSPQAKPKIWERPAVVSRGSRDWHSQHGISVPVLRMPMWAGAGQQAYDYGALGSIGQLSGDAPWAHDGVLCNGNMQGVNNLGTFDQLLSDECTMVLTVSNMGPRPDDLRYFFTCDTFTTFSSFYFQGSTYYRVYVSDEYFEWDMSEQDIKRQIAIRISTADQKVALSFDGVNQGDRSGTVSLPTGSTLISIGRNNATLRSLYGVATGATIFDSYLTDEQIYLLYEQPFADIQPRAAPYYLFVGAATGGVSGTLPEMGGVLSRKLTLNRSLAGAL